MEYSTILSQNSLGWTKENHNNWVRITGISSTDILDQFRDLGVNIKFLLPPGKCLLLNLIDHYNPVMSDTPAEHVIQPTQETFQDRLMYNFLQ